MLSEVDYETIVDEVCYVAGTNELTWDERKRVCGNPVFQAHKEAIDALVLFIRNAVAGSDVYPAASASCNEYKRNAVYRVRSPEEQERIVDDVECIRKWLWTIWWRGEELRAYGCGIADVRTGVADLHAQFAAAWNKRHQRNPMNAEGLAPISPSAGHDEDYKWPEIAAVWNLCHEKQMEWNALRRKYQRARVHVYDNFIRRSLKKNLSRWCERNMEQCKQNEGIRAKCAELHRRYQDEIDLLNKSREDSTPGEYAEMLARRYRGHHWCLPWMRWESPDGDDKKELPRYLVIRGRKKKTKPLPKALGANTNDQ